MKPQKPHFQKEKLKLKVHLYRKNDDRTLCINFKAPGKCIYAACRNFWAYLVKIYEVSFHLSPWELAAARENGFKMAVEKK